MTALRLFLLPCALALQAAYLPASHIRTPGMSVPRLANPPRVSPVSLRVKSDSEKITKDPEEVTKKFGLEAGLFTAAKGKDMSKAGDLLKQYGGAYLVTSISLALISFSLCYFAIDRGVDVAALLQRVGIEVSTTSETMGTVGIAYAIHKAASPIRFPPTVALTPIVARKFFGQKDADETD
uniref:DUF1279 domain-containing protein n=1 Tax=Chrysotila carterae TaxID=13221 RepID=A0A7S4C1E1_CHRCT|mmetsp:Transcript_30369/g.66606  ORF Transcript_30369/g.66606 Transcript_30369/m.66606 type:complete len:181 (-) Transcript_30369:401-943(-)|eukprot:1268263-Pleurochrysis_carterae.AAC.6